MNADNAQFLYEKLVFNRDFAAYMSSFIHATEICHSFLTSPVEKSQLRLAFAPVAEKLVIGILLHGSTWDDGSLQRIADALVKIIYNDDVGESAKLLDSFSAAPARLFNMLVKCYEPAVRRFVHTIALNAFARVRVAEEPVFDQTESVLRDKQMIQVPVSKARRFIDTLLSFVGNDLIPHWMRFKQLFELIRDLLARNRDLLGPYMLQNDSVALLLDFYLGKLSPLYTVGEKRNEMGSLGVSPDFEPLIEIVNNLVQCHILAGKGLSPKAWKCLYCTDIINKYLREGGKIGRLKEMVSALMRENMRYSKQVCSMLIRVINDYDLERLQQYMPLIADAVTIADSLQRLRMEWILGIPQPIAKVRSYGLAAIDDISQDVVCYVSSLGSKRFDDPLLQQLWRNKRRVDMFTTNCVRTMLLRAESSEQLFQYLKAMPAPTYQFAHYLGWVNAFLDSYEIAVSRYTDLLVRKERENLITEVRGLLQKFGQRMGAPQERYMVGKWVQEKEYFSQKFGDHNLRLTAFEVLTEVFPSRPDGKTNLGVDPEYLVKHFDHYRCDGTANGSVNPSHRNLPRKDATVEDEISAWEHNVARNVDMSKPTGGWKDEATLPLGAKAERDTAHETNKIIFTLRDEETPEEAATKKKKVEEKMSVDVDQSESKGEEGSVATPMQTEGTRNSKPGTVDMDHAKKEEQKSVVEPVVASAILKFELTNYGYFCGNVKLTLVSDSDNCYIPQSTIVMYIRPNMYPSPPLIAST